MRFALATFDATGSPLFWLQHTMIHFFLAKHIIDICGIIDTTNGLGSVFYIPGGLWELIIFPVWLFVKGFDKSALTNE
jgi:hypothetical protein